MSVRYTVRENGLLLILYFSVANFINIKSEGSGKISECSVAEDTLLSLRLISFRVRKVISV